MLLERPWDRPDPRSLRPYWLPPDVDRALSGLARAASHRLTRSTFDGVHYSYTDIDFECGCKAIGDQGWQPCDWALHQLLAQDTSTSRVAKAYFRLRAVFDAVLEAAWKARPMSHDNELHLRQRGFSLEEYRRSHDLADVAIWSREGLRADLHALPMQCELSLYNFGNAHRPRLGMELVREADAWARDEESVEIPAPTDVSDLTAEQITTLCAAR